MQQNMWFKSAGALQTVSVVDFGTFVKKNLRTAENGALHCRPLLRTYGLHSHAFGLWMTDD